MEQNLVWTIYKMNFKLIFIFSFYKEEKYNQIIQQSELL